MEKTVGGGSMEKEKEKEQPKPISIDEALKQTAKRYPDSGSSIVKPRTKEDPITVEGYLNDTIWLQIITLPEGWKKLDIYLDDTESFRDDFYLNFIKPSIELQKKKITGFLNSRNIKLKINARREDWIRLDYYFQSAFDEFIDDLSSNFVIPAIEYLTRRPLPGKHKNTYPLVSKMKIKASALYALLSYFLKRPLPEYLRKLIQMAEEDDKARYLIKNENKYNPKELVMFCIEKVYGEKIKSAGLNPFEDSEWFYETYIVPGLDKFRRRYITNKKPQEVANLVYWVPSLKTLFKSLKLI